MMKVFSKKQTLQIAKDICQTIELVDHSSRKIVKLALSKLKEIYNLENKHTHFYPDEIESAQSVKDKYIISQAHSGFRF